LIIIFQCLPADIRFANSQFSIFPSQLKRFFYQAIAPSRACVAMPETIYETEARLGLTEKTPKYGNPANLLKNGGVELLRGIQ